MRRAFQYFRQRTFIAWVDNFLKELKLAYNPHTGDEKRVLYQGFQAVQLNRPTQADSEFDYLQSERSHMPSPLDIKK